MTDFYWDRFLSMRSQWGRIESLCLKMSSKTPFYCSVGKCFLCTAFDIHNHVYDFLESKNACLFYS